VQSSSEGNGKRHLVVNRSVALPVRDLERLRALLRGRLEAVRVYLAYLQELDEALTRAEIIEGDAPPRDVVSVGSRVLVQDVHTGERISYELVFPSEPQRQDARQESVELPVLAPLALALLGRREGEQLEWRFPRGARLLEIAMIGRGDATGAAEAARGEDATLVAPMAAAFG